MADKAQKTHMIEVDDYYDKVHQSTWTRRSAAIMAGVTLGGSYGAVIGAIAAFVPTALTMIPVLGITAAMVPPVTVAAVAASAAIFAGIAGLIGLAAVSIVGGEAASVSSGLTEKEKREKTGLLKENGLLDPSANIEVKVKEGADKWPVPFKLRVAMFTVPLFAAFGAILAISPITAPTVIGASGLGTLGLAVGEKALEAGGASAIAASTAAVATASAIIFGMWGVVFATPQSYYTNKLTNFYTKVLKDKLFDDKDISAEVNSMVAAYEGKAQSAEMSSPSSHHSKQFPAEKPQFSFQRLLENEKHAPDSHLIGR